MAAAKKKAENILDNDELGGVSKAKSVARLFRSATKNLKQKKIYAVFGKVSEEWMVFFFYTPRANHVPTTLRRSFVAPNSLTRQCSRGRKKL